MIDKYSKVINGFILLAVLVILVLELDNIYAISTYGRYTVTVYEEEYSNELVHMLLQN